MKIMFVINNMGIGGAQRVVSVLAKEMVSQGYSVSIVMTENCTNYAYDVDKRISCIRLIDTIKLTKATLVFLRIKYGMMIRLLPKKREYYKTLKYYNIKSRLLCKLIKQDRPDVVYSFLTSSNIPSCMIASCVDVPIIIAERNYPGGDKISDAMQYLRKKFYKLADLCVFQTREQREYYSDIPEYKCRIISNPIKDGLPNPYKGQRKKIIVNFCRLNRKKNLNLLIDAFNIVHEKHSDFQLRIYGEGELYHDLLNKIHELNLDACAMVLPFEKDIHDVVLDCAVFVSSSDYEGMPNSLLEAMAIGLPVVATDCFGGGAKAVIKNGVNGILVPRNDAVSLANGIIYLLENQTESERMAEFATHIREELSVANIAKKWISLLIHRNGD